MALIDATLRVPLIDHTASVEIRRGERPIQLVIDGTTYFLTVGGAAVLSQKLNLANQLVAEDRSDR